MPNANKAPANVPEHTQILEFTLGVNRATGKPQWQATSARGALCVPNNEGTQPGWDGQRWHCALNFYVARRIAVVTLVSPVQTRTQQYKQRRWERKEGRAA